LYYRCNLVEIQGVVGTVTALSVERKRGGGVRRDSLNGLESMSTAKTIAAVDRENNGGSNGSGTSGMDPDSQQEAGEIRQ